MSSSSLTGALYVNFSVSQRSSGSGFLEMSAFVCCVTAAALGRSSSDERRGDFMETHALLSSCSRLHTEAAAHIHTYPEVVSDQLVINWCLLVVSTAASVGDESAAEGGAVIIPFCEAFPGYLVFQPANISA
ncbi:hypothetical protein ABVT39_008218 [Epinephelus coioides]